MSRSYTRNLNTASLITLCPVCLHSFQDAKRATLRRADLRQRSKDTCTCAARILVLTARPAMGSTTTFSPRLTGTRPGGRRKRMLRRLKIDPEFQSKIPPLTFEKLNLLETNILEEGRILNPLIV